MLERVLAAISDSVHPCRIVLYGSRARGDARPESDYDLMVELATGLDHEAGRQAIDRALRGITASRHIVVRVAGEFDARRNDPGTIDWAIAREGVAVYANTEALRRAPLLPPARVVRESPAEPPPSLEEWLQLATEDLTVMELAIGANLWGPAGFNAQQAAEKYLKALLVKAWRAPPRTHDLGTLVAEVRAAGFDLPDLTAECEVLHPYAVNCRYGGIQPNAATGRAVVEAGRRMINVARQLL